MSNDYRLNLGCGHDIKPGWVNIDSRGGPGVDLVRDLDRKRVTLPFPTDSVVEIYGSHILEHLRDPLPMMAELWRVAAPGCVATFRTPHGGSDDAWEDPTHVRPIFPGSYHYFGQPVYWRADYAYKADWRIESIDLHVSRAAAECPDDELPAAAIFSRNIIAEMVATLIAVKPARPSERALMEAPAVRFIRPRT